MVTNELNRGIIWRMIRRIPIAAVIAYLFLTSYYAAGWRNPGLVIVVGTLMTLLAVIVLNVRPVAWVMNFPIKIYMGRNNRLWLWLFVFAILSTGMFLTTSGRKQELSAASTKQTDVHQQRMDEIREQYQNKRQLGVFKTNAELAQEAHQQNPDTWVAMETRFHCTWMLWLLVVLYGPIAISDEIASGFNKVVQRMHEKGEMVSKPLFYDAASKMLKVAVPAVAGTAVAGAAGATMSKTSSFWWEVLKEAAAEAAVRISPLGRRR